MGSCGFMQYRSFQWMRWAFLVTVVVILTSCARHCSCQDNSTTARPDGGDINECSGSPSPCTDQNSECHKREGNYTCDCKNGYNRTIPGANCTDINECSGSPSPCTDQNSECHNREGNYTCDCKTGYNRTSPGTNCTDIDECADNLSLCSDTNLVCHNTGGSYYCDCKTGYSRNSTAANCTDINECTLNSSACADPNSKCENSIGSYSCICNPGYNRTSPTDNCIDIDECSAQICGEHADLCENQAGTYQCLCKKGWKGNNCTEDKDECTENATICDDPNAVCQNTNGSYTCDCKVGFERVTPSAKCTVEVLLPYKDNSRQYSGDDDIFGPFDIPEGFMAWGSPHTAFFVSTNGYISFDTKFARTFAPELESAVLEKRSIIAPYWTDIDIPSQSGTAGLYIKVVSLAETFANASKKQIFEDLQGKIRNMTGESENFKATYIAVLTWQNVLPYKAENFRDIQAATFQLALTTDGLHSLAIINYRSVWPEGTHVKVVKLLHVNDSMGTAQNPPKDVPKKEVFRLYNTSSIKSTNADCISWVHEKDRATYPAAVPCPCSVSQAQADVMFQMNHTTHCATSKMWNDAGTKRICCYAITSGMLIKTARVAGPNQPLMFKDSDMETNKGEGFQKCCGDAATLCYKFYDIFPLDTCATYAAPSTALLWGDPHLVTLDGTEFSFNGWGEYVVLKTSDGLLEVQGRTDKTANYNVTVFKAFALKNGNDSVIEVQHAGNGSLNVQLNKTAADFSRGAITEDHTYVEQTDLGKTVHIITTSGVSIKITEMADRLSLSLSAPTGKLPRSRGLLGYVDGNPANDFTFQNGTVLAADTAPEDIFQFGQSWLIPFENQSLFTYMTAKTFASYQHSDFMPTLLPSKVEDILQALNKSNKMEIGSKLCGTYLACLQDLLITGDNNTALATKGTQEDVKTLQTLLALKLPEFDNPQEVWNISLTSSSFTYNLHVKSDSTGAFPTVKETITVLDALNYTFTQVAGTPGTWQFIWNLTEALANVPRILITFKATNAANLSTEYMPIIVLCACSQDSQCSYSSLPGVIQQYAAMGEAFYSLKCECDVGSGGRFCEQKVDVCDSCYTNASCNRNATDGKYCQACPTGYGGDGLKCYELNECLVEGNCDQHCENTVDGYRCFCNSGYKLMEQSKCIDIDECAEKTDNCKPSQFCNNTAGSFYCVCRPGSGGTDCQAKVSHVYIGRLVFRELAQKNQIWSNDLELTSSTAFRNLADKVQHEVSMVLTNGGVYYIGVTVTEFKLLIESRSQRRRRSVDTLQPMIQATFQVETNTSHNVTELDEALKKGYNASCTGNLCQFGNSSNPLYGVSRDESSFDANYNLCASDRHNDCHDPSTYCHSEDGSFNCTCRQGYQRWDLSNTACEDLDECLTYNVTYNCGVEGATCHNKMGSYFCTCPTTHRWNGSICELYKCQSNPCHNGGTCVDIGENPSFACRCAYGWTGPTCAEEDSEAEKMKSIAIGVGVGFGVLSLILIIIIIIICTVRSRCGIWKTREDSMHKYTQFQRYDASKIDRTSAGARDSASGTQQYNNPVFTHDDEYTDRL